MRPLSVLINSRHLGRGSAFFTRKFAFLVGPPSPPVRGRTLPPVGPIASLTMSLETLLEAARYLEYRTEAKARGEPHDYNTYAKLANGGGGGGLPSASDSNNPEDSPPSSNSDELGKERRRTLGAGTREVHNKLEKNRRAHLKECFDCLKKQIPGMDDKKTSNLSILRSALRYIQVLKKKERDYEHEMERLAREKISQQQRLVTLKKEMALQADNVDVSSVYPDSDVDNESNSTSTASECGPLSDLEDDRVEVPVRVPLPTPVPIQTNSGSINAIVQGQSSGKVTITRLSGLPTSIKVPHPNPSISAINAISKSTTIHSGPSPVTNASPTAVNAITKPISVQGNFSQSAVVPTAVVSAKPAAPIALGSVSSLTASTPVQIPAQIMSQTTGIHINSNAGVLAHPGAVQVIAQPGVRVISATSSSVLSATLSTINSSISTTTSPTFTNGVNVLTQNMVTPSSAASKSIMVPTVAFTKPSLLSVPVVTQNAPTVTSSLTQGKTLMATMPTLTIPTTLTSLPRTMTLQTAPVPTQGIVSFTGISGTIGTTTTLPSGAIQVTNANLKPTTQILHQTLSQQRTMMSPAVRNQSPQGNTIPGNANSISRQIVATTVKPVAQVRAPMAQITHMVQPTSLASVGQLVSPAGHVSAMTPLMGPMSVMNHAVAQMIAQPPLGKVTVAGSPILKPVGQIPLVQQQFLTSAQPVVKPLVVVSTPNIVSATVSNAQSSMTQNTPVTLSASQC